MMILDKYGKEKVNEILDQNYMNYELADAAVAIYHAFENIEDTLSPSFRTTYNLGKQIVRGLEQSEPEEEKKNQETMNKMDFINRDSILDWDHHIRPLGDYGNNETALRVGGTAIDTVIAEHHERIRGMMDTFAMTETPAFTWGRTDMHVGVDRAERDGDRTEEVVVETVRDRILEEPAMEVPAPTLTNARRFLDLMDEDDIVRAVDELDEITMEVEETPNNPIGNWFHNTNHTIQDYEVAMRPHQNNLLNGLFDRVRAGTTRMEPTEGGIHFSPTEPAIPDLYGRYVDHQPRLNMEYVNRLFNMFVRSDTTEIEAVNQVIDQLQEEEIGIPLGTDFHELYNTWSANDAHPYTRIPRNEEDGSPRPEFCSSFIDYQEPISMDDAVAMLQNEFIDDIHSRSWEVNDSIAYFTGVLMAHGHAFD